MTVPEVGGGPSAASAASSAALQYVPEVDDPSSVVLDPRSRRRACDTLDGVVLLGQPVVERRGDHRRRVDRELRPDCRDDRLQL